MTHQPYTYTILRYVHDIRTGEFLNVGVVLHVPAPSDVLFRTRTTYGRAKSLFPDLDGEAFLDAMSAVRRALSGVTKDAEPSGLFGRENDAAGVARRAFAGRRQRVAVDAGGLWRDGRSRQHSSATRANALIYHLSRISVCKTVPYPLNVSSEMSSRVDRMGRMTRAPVYYAIVQARFNPLMALESYVSRIQDRFRLHGFPDAQTNTIATFNLAVIDPTDPGASKVPVSQTARYNFSNMEKTAGFLLDQNSLSLQTTDYEIFEKFSQVFLEGLDIINDVVKLTYTDRIGVRYLDAVYPDEGRTLRDYLNPSVLGLSTELSGTLMHAFSETFVRIDLVNVIARTILQDGLIAFPPDLQPIGLTILERFQNSKGSHAILDTDGSQDKRVAFNLDQVRAILYIVHDAVTSAFKATVTEYALQVWR